MCKSLGVAVEDESAVLWEGCPWMGHFVAGPTGGPRMRGEHRGWADGIFVVSHGDPLGRTGRISVSMTSVPHESNTPSEPTTLP